MKVMFIGGVGDGLEIEKAGTSRTAILPFKLEGDFASDRQHVHTYEMKSFTARRPDGEIVEVDFFVHQGLRIDAVKSLVHARTLLEIEH